MIPAVASRYGGLRDVFRQSLTYTAGNLLTRSVGFLLLPLYTAYLSPAEYGIIELAELTIAVSGMLFGISAAGDALIRVFHDYEDPAEQHSVVSTALAAGAALSLVVAAAGAFAAPILARTILRDASLGPFLAVSFVAIVISVQMELCLVFLRLKGRATLYVAYSVIFALCQMACNVVLIAYAHLGIWGFLLSKLLCSVPGAVLLLAIVFRSGPFSWNRPALARMLRFGAPLAASSLAFFVIHFSDRFFLSRYATISDVGVYSVGFKFGFLITFLVGEPFGRVWNAKLFEVARSTPDWPAEFARVFANLFAALVVVWCGLAFFAPAIVAVMVDDAFQSAAAVIPWIAAAYVVRECGDFFRQVLYLDRRPDVVRNVAALTAIASIALNAAIIPFYGARGAAAATLAAWSLYAAVIYRFSQRGRRIPYGGRRVLSLAVPVAMLFAAQLWLASDRLALRAAQATLCVVLVLVWLWISGYLEATARRSITDGARQAWRRLVCSVHA